MGLTWPFLLMFGSHDMRHIGFRRLTVVNETPENWGVIVLFIHGLPSFRFETLKDFLQVTKNYLFIRDSGISTKNHVL